MAAPTKTARGVPDGVMLEDGFKCLLAFALAPEIGMWEIEVTPPGTDGGDSIDITTQHNVEFRTKALRQLKDRTDGSFTCGYDPASEEAINTMINKPQSITRHYPDGSAIAEYGGLTKFTPQGLSEGGFPTAQCTYVQTNRDPTTHEEQGPVYFEPVGT